MNKINIINEQNKHNNFLKQNLLNKKNINNYRNKSNDFSKKDSIYISEN